MNMEQYDIAILTLTSGSDVRRSAFRKVRKEILQMTQPMFGAVLGVTLEQISRWENGHQEISDTYLMALVGYLYMRQKGLIR